MKQRVVSPDTWRQLYALARQVESLAPWTWMEEIDIFGVEMPGAGPVVFVSVMGAIAQHFAVAVYPDVAAITAFWALQHDEDVEPERVLEIPQLQLSFENRDHLQTEDRRILKQLGLSFKGKHAWPLFRSYRPGFVPWFLESDEAETLRVALDQLLAVAPTFRDDPAAVEPPDPFTYLIRINRSASAGAGWTDELRKVPPVEIPIPRVLLNADQVRQCHALPKVQKGIELDFFLMPAPIREGKDRPFYPYVLLLVESESGAIVGQDLLTVDESIGEMWSRVPSKLVDQLKTVGVRPARLIVLPGRMEAIMRPVAEVLGIELRVHRRLGSLDPAKKGLIEFLAGESR